MASIADLPLPSHPALLLLFVVGAAVAVALGVLAIGRVLARLLRRKTPTLSGELARRLPFPLAILSGIVVAGMGVLGMRERLDPVVFTHLVRLLGALFLITLAWGALRVLRVGLNRVASRRDRFQPAALLTSRLVSLLIYAFVFLAILSDYGVAITPLLTGLGLAALAVGLALQDTLANFFAGIWIQTERPLAPGHFVRMEDQKIEGFVEQVGWRTTRIRTLPGNLVVMPNSKVAQAVVTDFTMPTPVMSVVMNFTFPFDQDPKKIMTLLVEEAKEAAKAHPFVLEEPAPFANNFPGIGEYGLGYSLIIKVPQFIDQWNAQTVVTGRIWARMQREGIPMAYPTRVNLSSDGVAFAPKPPSKRVASKAAPASAPEGRDPREIVAEQATQEIAARVAQEAAKGGTPKAVASEAAQSAAEVAGASPAAAPITTPVPADQPRAATPPSPPPAATPPPAPRDRDEADGKRKA